MKTPLVTLKQLIDRYVERQVSTPEELKARLDAIASAREVEGWMLLECHMFGSSRLGDLTILPYGPGCTFKTVPEHPISPRGLASDMSVVVAVAPAAKEA